MRILGLALLRGDCLAQFVRIHVHEVRARSLMIAEDRKQPRDPGQQEGFSRVGEGKREDEFSMCRSNFTTKTHHPSTHEEGEGPSS
jgi:hypothetical protein